VSFAVQSVWGRAFCGSIRLETCLLRFDLFGALSLRFDLFADVSFVVLCLV
jgi:hypothetical protein